MAYKTKEFSTLVEELMGSWHVLGLSIAVIQGEEIWSKAYGKAQLPDTQCTDTTLFDAASCSKITTAAAIACLVDDDKYPHVKWTTPVCELIPDDFVMQDERYTKEITLEDLLCHRTGFPRHDESYLGSKAATPDDAKTITRNLRNLPVAKPLREKWMYCNIMFTVASHVVEVVSGESYVDFVRKRIWEPLGMTNTFHDISDIEAHDRMDSISDGSRWDETRAEYVSFKSPPQPEGQGAGCIWSSAGDYAKWIRALIRKSGPLSKDSFKQLETPRMVVPLEDDEEEVPFYGDELYALGLQRENYRGHLLLRHSGSVDGFRAKIAYIPKLQWGIVIFANSEMGYWVASVLSHTLMDDAIGVRAADHIDWKSYYRQCYERDTAKEKEKELDPKYKRPEHPEPLPVPLESLVGSYFDPGYKGLEVKMGDDGKLVADCTDRGAPWMLTFEHLTGTALLVTSDFVNVDEKRLMRGEVKVEAGKVIALGIPYEEDIEPELIWFKKTG